MPISDKPVPVRSQRQEESALLPRRPLAPPAQLSPRGGARHAIASIDFSRAPVQAKRGGKKKKQQRQERAIAYQERLEQRQRDQVLGRSVREQIDLRHPTRPEPLRAQSEQRLGAMEQEDQEAWRATLEANLPLMPDGYVPTVRKVPDLGPDALTSFNDKNKEVQVRYDPDVVTYRDSDRRVGRLAATFSHELTVHGKNVDAPDEDEEHAAMHDPHSRGDYLDASHRTFNRLANDKQQRAFANEWRKDLENQIAWDENLGHGEKTQRRQWARQRRNSMVDAIARPERHAWTKKVSPRQTTHCR